MTETFYDVLGVSPDASAGEIEDAYRERLKETHPDLNDDDDADVATQRVIEARDVLTDADERARYDRIGHEAYVGEGSTAGTGDDTDAASAASKAAREAGWADGTTDSEGPTAAGTNAGPYERRRRERTARERVRADRTRRDRGRSREPRGAATEPTGETTTDGGPAGAEGAARSRAKRDRIYGSGDWSTSSGYNVRQDVGPTTHPLRRLIANTSPSLFASTFFLYPVMLFSALFPPFPLAVNVTVGLCTVFLVGYLQSRPSVGLLVFGAWSLLVPLGIVAFGLNPTGIVALAALAGAVLPLGFSVLTWSILRL